MTWKKTKNGYTTKDGYYQIVVDHSDNLDMRDYDPSNDKPYKPYTLYAPGNGGETFTTLEDAKASAEKQHHIGKCKVTNVTEVAD